ncbi:hypothetical protein DRQ32_12590, partial [bacterium]
IGELRILSPDSGDEPAQQTMLACPVMCDLPGVAGKEGGQLTLIRGRRICRRVGPQPLLERSIQALIEQSA